MRALLTLTALLGALLLGACGRAPLQEQQAFVFGTRVEVLVAGGDAEQGRQAIAAVLREFDRLHRHFHAWQESELTALNSAIFSGRPQTVSDELAAFIREAQQLSARGDHLFDPGIGRLIALWGFQSDEFAARLPEGPHAGCANTPASPGDQRRFHTDAPAFCASAAAPGLGS